jgi:hypothetical protein
VHRYASLMTLSYRERLQAMLAEVGVRFGVKEARGTLLTLELGHDDWAEMIGSPGESFASRIPDKEIVHPKSRTLGPSLGLA